MTFRSLFRKLVAAAAIPGIGMATKVTIDRQFGGFGSTLQQAKATGFFSWFHLTETARESSGGSEVVRFQPSGPKFHDVAIVSFETGGQFIEAATLRLSRSFINGPDEAFARDIAASFLRTALPAQDRIQAEDLILQIANDYRGTALLIVARGADPRVPQPLTPAYRVFVGEEVEASITLAHMNIRLLNTRSGGDHLLIRIDLARPGRIASPCGSGGRK